MVYYHADSIVKLNGGFGSAKVYKVTEESTGTAFVLKYGTPEQNVNAVLVSEFLKKVLNNAQITIRGKKYNYHTPNIEIDHDLNGAIVQKQEFLNDLSPTVDGKKIQGIASADSVREAAKFGVIYQFLMLGDNISHNNRISADGRFNIFDFDSAFNLGGQCMTSPDAPNFRKVVASELN